MELSEFIFLVGTPTVAVLIVILNGITVILLCREYWKKQKNNSHRGLVSTLFLINLTLSDLLVGFILIIIKIINIFIRQEEFKDNETLFSVYNFLLFWFLRFSNVASLFNLLAISMERVIAVRHPLRCHLLLTSNKAKVICLAIWLLTISITALHYQFTPFGYQDLLYPATVIPAGIIFIICYLHILITLRFYSRPPENDASLEMNKLSTYVLKRETRLMRFVVVVALTFCITWMPICVTSIMKSVYLPVGMAVSNLTFFLAFCNSVINPILYLKFTLRSKLRASDWMPCVRYRRARPLVSAFEVSPRLKNQGQNSPKTVVMHSRDLEEEGRRGSGVGK